MSTTRSAVHAIRARRGHKERSKNFTELEKRTVLELIARHRDVLRQGRSNNATNRSKQLVWSTICEEVNKRCGGERPRTPAQVKMWYENYKKKCKMRAHEAQPPQPDAPGLLDGMLWQNIHPLDVKDDDEVATSEQGHSVKDDDCLPVNMSNGRLSSTNDSDDAPNPLEPHVTICAPPASPPLPLLHPAAARRLGHGEPLDLRHLDRDGERDKDKDCASATEEERLYFIAKRQHAIWEHEAKMKILHMELKQKEEIFSLQKQLFLIELRLKMDFLEKASGK